MGSQEALAVKPEMAEAYSSGVLNNRRAPGDKISVSLLSARSHELRVD
jgi:hypothetical protein